MSKNLTQPSKGNILVVDDQPNNLRVLSSMLTKHGYHVRKALNGQIAVSACQTVLPDLILLDIMMPNMDGYEVCQVLKADEKTREVPVIFISALDDVLDKVKAFRVGGIDYITKPFQIEEVLVRVTNQLTIQQQHRQLTEQNAKLQKLNEELACSNAELEQFAYIASHDLQSPLQAIVGYARILSWKYEKNLDDDAKRYIERIVNAGWRMTQLIEDLLAYSRVGTRTEEFNPTDCKTVLEEALGNLREEISSSGASITHSDLPTIRADRTQLMRLFQNLISNSIKFRRPEVPPSIEITAQPKNNDEWLIAVRDNGIGIETENFERIFEIFQRLHSYNDYPGTGIGMSICKKIVERHGGRIWVESQIEVGTTFYFTIPNV
ncbi:ATP-binding protein [Argonema galeatum]|uniref:ATP-binding protein n=1 Tax=Argonema galeatum TaxID=2942762 RepID=UPI0020122342|nr:ATP-binding protein [Argonema galeatum]MCL1465214.1 response regulator [Argonema galeatum A003/A1]